MYKFFRSINYNILYLSSETWSYLISDNLLKNGNKNDNLTTRLVNFENKLTAIFALYKILNNFRRKLMIDAAFLIIADMNNYIILKKY